MSSWTSLGVVVALFTVFEAGCTFITACPTGTNNNTPSAGASGMGNQPGGAGSSGVVGVDIPTGVWVNATANLAGIPSECGNLSGMSAKPDEDMLIAGVSKQGLWASRDGGTTWTQLGTGMGSDSIVNRLTSVVYDPDNSMRFWESGIYNGGGAYETEDDGVTFHALGDVMHNDLISVDLSDPDRKTILVGGHEQEKLVFRSSDSGKTWDSIGGGLPGATNCTLPMLIDPQTYLVGCGGYGGGPSGVYRTIDAGMNWTVATASGGGSDPVRASDGTIYWPSPNGAAMTHSTDNGQTWTDVDGSAGNVTTLIELPDRRLVSLNKKYVLISADQGATWTIATSALPYTDANPASGVVYSAQEKAFFIWHFTCGFDGPVPVPSDAIMRYDFDYQANADN